MVFEWRPSIYQADIKGKEFFLEMSKILTNSLEGHILDEVIVQVFDSQGQVWKPTHCVATDPLLQGMEPLCIYDI